MAPTVESPVDAAFFLNAMFHLENGKVNWAAVARDNGISHGKNAPSKFNNLAKKYGYKYEAGKMIRITDPATATGSATTIGTLSTTATTGTTSTPTKLARGTKSPRKKGSAATSKTSAATPTKKRKVEQSEEEDEEAEDEVTGRGKAVMSTDDEAEED